MKKYLLIAAAMLVTAFMSSCDKEDEKSELPNVQFETSSYTLDDVPVTVKLVSSKAPDADLTIGFSLSGTAEITDYELSATSFTLKAGEKEAAVTITPKAVYDESKTLILTLQSDKNYQIGRLKASTVTMKPEEYVYSFTAKTAYVLENLEVELTINDPDYKAHKEIEIPFKALSGSTAIEGTDYTVKNNATKFVIPQGGRTASITLEVADDLDVTESKIINLGLDVTEGGQFIGGEFASIKILIKGPVTSEVLSGKWEFVELIGLEELEICAKEEGVDLNLLPSSNTGYYFEIKEESGVWKFVQGSVAGDLSHLFRTSDIKNTAPINDVEGTPSGNYVMKNEQYMYDYTKRYDLTYFELDPGNRSFDNSNESLGKIIVAIQLNDDDTLALFLRDHDKPLYFQHWWDEGYPMDTELFGFGFTFKKVN